MLTFLRNEIESVKNNAPILFLSQNLEKKYTQFLLEKFFTFGQKKPILLAILVESKWCIKK